MALTAIPFHHDRLRKAIRRQIHLLDAVSNLQIWVCRLAAEVHRNTVVHKILHGLPSIWVVHDVTIRDRAVLPV